MKNTKKSLISAVVALVVCFAMLVGTTFAWFTDSASVGIETIQTGELNLTVEDADGNSWEGKQLKWVSADSTKTTNYWEPGATYETEQFYIKNEGNLNLKFKISLDDFQGDLELLNVITFDILVDAGEFTFRTQSTPETGSGNVKIDLSGTIIDLLEGYHKESLVPQIIPSIDIDEYPLQAGQILGPLTIKAHMSEEAGNEYMNKSLTGIGFTIIATQEIGESDSESEWYDKDSEYPVLPTKVSDFDKLNEVLSAGGSVQLQNDITTTDTLILNPGREFDGNGMTISATTAVGTGNATINPQGGTIKNLVVQGTGNTRSPYGIGSIQFSNTTLMEDLVIENVDISKTRMAIDLNANGNSVYVKDSEIANMVQIANQKEAVFENCHFTREDVSMLAGTSAWINVLGSMKFINCHFEEDVDLVVDDRYFGTIEFTNCTYGKVNGANRLFEPTVDFFTYWMEAKGIVNYNGSFGDGDPGRTNFTCIVNDTVVWEAQN